MTVTTPETAVERVCRALSRYSESLAVLLRGVSDPTRPAVGVWNIAETAVHVSQSAPFFLAAARGEEEPENLEDNAQATQAGVNAEPERRLAVLADRVVRGERELVDYARSAEGDPIVVPFQRASMPLSSMLSIELGELLVHGFDVARASGLRWDIEPVDAATAVDGALQVLPSLLDESRTGGVRLSCDLRVRHGRQWLIAVENDALTLAQDGIGRDCHVSVDPVTFLLLTFNRISPVRPIMTGKIVVWGRKPWAFPKLQSLLKQV